MFRFQRSHRTTDVSIPDCVETLKNSTFMYILQLKLNGV